MFQIMLLLGLLASLCYLLVSPAPKIDIYDDGAIIQEGDSYFSTSYRVENTKILAKDFSGTDTMISMEGGYTMDIQIDVKLASGQLRIVWITPDDRVHELKEGTHTLSLCEGKHRIKVIGSQADFELTYQTNI
jgi:hypothetical protein